MRAFLPLLALALLAAPVRAADQTEALHLLNISAGEAETILRTNPSKEPLIPVGIHAWSVDSRANNLVLVGEPAAIDQVRRIIRLIDVPPRKIRLHIRALQPDAALDPLKNRGALQEDGELGILGVSEDADRAVIQARTVLSDFHLEVATNSPFHLRPTGSDKVFAVQTRLNGDSSVTFLLPSVADHGKPTLLTRIQPGGGLLVFMPKRGQVLFIDFELLEP